MANFKLPSMNFINNLFINKRLKYKKRAFTLIEALVFLFIFSVITLTIYNIFSLSSRYILEAKNKLGAISIAREKTEIIRNLPYNEIGTVNGSVSGNLLDEENVSENSRTYKIRTTVEYVQDDFDGTYPPEDVAWEDYKKVTIAVTWTNKTAGNEEVRMSSYFVPPGLEVANPNDGILVINVFSDQPGGTGIPSASVRVVNSETGLNTNVQTNNSGTVILTGDKIRESIQKYKITVTKNGYETIQTFPPYPLTSYNPRDVHASVVIGSVNVINIAQNELASLKIKTLDYLGETAVPNISFNLKGGRVMGTEATEPFATVYNMNENTQTNSNGEKNFGEVSPGQYTFTLAPSVTNYVLIDTDPISPFFLFSEDDITVKAKLADKNKTSLLIRVAYDNEGSLTPIAGANVRLSNGSNYDVTQTTSNTGTVFFPNTADEFLAGTYNISVTVNENELYNNQVIIDENQLKIENINITSP